MCNQSQGYYGSNNTLSPAAQAVWEAFNEEEAGVFVDYGEKLAAALRAAADCIVPGKLLADNLEESIAGRERFLVYQKLLAIADELEQS